MPAPSRSICRFDELEPPFARPYVISWNLTYRCNLACEHCYLDAGGTPLVGTENFADRSELGTDECFRVIDEIAAFAPECLTILTGGEPLLRRDILEIVRRAAERGLWVVVGTNGVRITENLARRLAEAGARGLSLSLDALDPDRHDRFRKVRGAWRNTVEGAEILNRTGLPFIVQTTAGSHNLGELDAIADFAHDRLAAKVWNLYFLVPTGRGQFVSDITPAQYDEVLASLYRIQRKYDGRMLVNAKCAPHYIKTVLENAGAEPRIGDPGGAPIASRRATESARTACRSVRDQDLLRRGRRVPGGDALHGDTAERRCHPVPLPPGLRGDSSQLESRGPLDVLGAVRRHSPPHLARRAMRGVRDERPLRRLPRPGLRDDRRSDGRRSALHAHARDVRRALRFSRSRGSMRLRLRGGARRSRDRVRRRIADDDRVGRCGRRAHEEDPRVRPGDGREGRRGFLPQERLDRVTVEELERIRARMPTPKIFGREGRPAPPRDRELPGMSSALGRSTRADLTKNSVSFLVASMRLVGFCMGRSRRRTSLGPAIASRSLWRAGVSVHLGADRADDLQRLSGTPLPGSLSEYEPGDRICGVRLVGAACLHAIDL